MFIKVDPSSVLQTGAGAREEKKEEARPELSNFLQTTTTSSPCLHLLTAEVLLRCSGVLHNERCMNTTPVLLLLIPD